MIGEGRRRRDEVGEEIVKLRYHGHVQNIRTQQPKKQPKNAVYSNTELHYMHVHVHEHTIQCLTGVRKYTMWNTVVNTLTLAHTCMYMYMYMYTLTCNQARYSIMHMSINIYVPEHASTCICQRGYISRG